MECRKPNQTLTMKITLRNLYTVLLLAALLLFLTLTGCATTQATKDKWSQTGSFLLNKAKSIATRVVLNAAVSSLDKGNKADFLDGASLGLRSEMQNVVTGDDIARVIGIWTPPKEHWQELGTNLGKTFDDAKEKDKAVAVEAIASGLNNAARLARR